MLKKHKFTKLQINKSKAVLIIFFKFSTPRMPETQRQFTQLFILLTFRCKISLMMICGDLKTAVLRMKEVLKTVL